MDFTMLRQICRHGRLVGFIQDYINTDGPFSTALKVLFPDAVITPTELPIITPNNEALQNSKGKRLSPNLYQSILTHVNTLWPNTPF
jgi:hypothetical protein